MYFVRTAIVREPDSGRHYAWAVVFEGVFEGQRTEAEVVRQVIRKADSARLEFVGWASEVPTDVLVATESHKGPAIFLQGRTDRDTSLTKRE